MPFDSSGNIYITDRSNNRIQKFVKNNFCGQSTMVSTTPQISTEKIPSTMITTSLIVTTTALSYFLSNCCDPNRMGTNCNISSTPCNMLDPCENQGTCLNIITHRYGYNCSCVRGFDGERCQYDHRPCRPTTCWNKGTCNETLKTILKCQCQPGWTGDHCELMINYCQNIICKNKGVCRRLLMNYTCDCVENFSGRHCEIVAKKIVILQAISKSVGFIAIIVLVSTAAFFVIMDILKYCFCIDLTRDELERIRRTKAIERAKKRRRPVIQRFTYVNAPSPEQQPKNRKKSANFEETTV